MKQELNKTYWDNRFLNCDTPWDLGYCSPPLKKYFDNLTNKELEILVPGAGNAYEAEYLFNKGFKNVYVLDISTEAIKLFTERVRKFPKEQIICQDFFAHKKQYDLIVEQTFFCALNPVLRSAYAMQVRNLLKPNGKLIGLMFNNTFEKAGPPFGGSKNEYEATFLPHFKNIKMTPCLDSIKPRLGNEIFVEISEKQF